MVRVLYLLSSLVAVTSASSQLLDPDFAALLKRQAPGTPSYNCHDNCGQAITLSRRPNPCTNEAFKTNYNNCLQCAGPDNYNIWRMYGNTLTSAGSGCGLSTTPLAGKQPDVGPAVQANGSSSAVASATASNVSARPSASGSAAAASSGASAAVSSPSASRNGTASATSPVAPQQSTNAASWLGAESMSIFGSIVVGAWFTI